MKLCVIGAGGAGLCAARYGSEFGCTVTVFEKTAEVGGTWVYTDDVGVDKNGLEVHSSRYQGLYTNLPKEIMGFPDFQFCEQSRSYIPAEDVLQFYQAYADKFHLLELIRFETQVVRVRPLNDKWEVLVQDMKLNKFETSTFDAVLVCNGHYTTPNHVHFEGQSNFAGLQLHSHDYRTAAMFKGESVLVIGAGPSGTDITIEIAKVAKNVTWSHHLKQPPVTQFSDNVSQKPDVQKITKTGVCFVDGSYEDFSAIVYCTGYKYSFPFLSVDCGIEVGENYVRPLYKHCLSIIRPTLGLIGLPNFICPNQMFDLQVRFCLEFMLKRKQLPATQKMLDDLKNDTELREKRGVFENIAHFMGPGIQDLYYADLAATAGITPISPVIAKIFAIALHNLVNEPSEFRSRAFKILDDDNFVLIPQVD